MPTLDKFSHIISGVFDGLLLCSPFSCLGGVGHYKPTRTQLAK